MERWMEAVFFFIGEMEVVDCLRGEHLKARVSSILFKIRLGSVW